MQKLNNFTCFLDGQELGICTGIDFAAEPDYSVETLIFKDRNAKLHFIPYSATLSSLQQLQRYMNGENQKYNRQLLPGAFISTI